MISVRRLAVADVGDYRKIRLAALLRAPDSFGSTYEAEAARPLSLFEERVANSAVFGAYDGSEIVGTACMLVEDGAYDRHKGRLVGMYVQPEVRGQGVGTALMHAIIECATGLVEQILLCVVVGNEPAIGLYTRFGFTVYGTEPRALKSQTGYSDEMLMVKFLSP